MFRKKGITRDIDDLLMVVKTVTPADGSCRYMESTEFDAEQYDQPLPADGVLDNGDLVTHKVLRFMQSTDAGGRPTILWMDHTDGPPKLMQQCTPEDFTATRQALRDKMLIAAPVETQSVIAPSETPVCPPHISPEVFDSFEALIK